jgi:hypothetical protein
VVDAWGLIEVTADAQEPNMVRNQVRIFRAGVCEWARRYDVPDPHAIPTRSYAQDVHNALAYFASIYDTVGYAGRLAVFVHIDNAEKAWLSLSDRLGLTQRRTPAGIESINAYQETTVDALLADPMPALRHSMQRIWQAFGYPACLLFDEAGDWVPDR